MNSFSRNCLIEKKSIGSEMGFRHGGGTSENVENHVRENIRWILFKTHNFYMFFRCTIGYSKCKIRIIYNVWWGLSCGSYYYLDIK